VIATGRDAPPVDIDGPLVTSFTRSLCRTKFIDV
jgi:hypothetical protein